MSGFVLKCKYLKIGIDLDMVNEGGGYLKGYVVGRCSNEK